MVQSTLVNRNCIRSLTQDPKWPFDKSLKMTLEQTSLVEYMLVMMTFHDFMILGMMTMVLKEMVAIITKYKYNIDSSPEKPLTAPPLTKVQFFVCVCARVCVRVCACVCVTV